MASGWSNRGKYLILQSYFRNTGTPTNFYLALVTSAATPSATTNTLSDLTEIASGNGYSTGGFSLTRNSTDFATLTEDDANSKGKIILKNIVWTASGGNLPSSGSGARYAVLLTDEVTVANRQVIAYFDLASDRTVSDTQTLTLSGVELDLTE